MKILWCFVWTALLLSVQWSAFAKKPKNRGRGRGRPFQIPPGHYKRLTIDQIIMNAYGGPDVVSNMGRKMSDGLITAELDMNLTPKQYSRLYGNSRQLGKRKATSYVNRRWTNKVIPYQIVYSHFSYEELAEIKEALAEWEKFTCIKFRQYTGSEENRIRIQNGKGCNSGVGMTGGIQDVNLQSPGCRYKGLYLHEVGHAIGLLHEHQLPNRDNYISIKLSNVAPSMRHWFSKYSPDAVDVHGVDYDYTSVMHYGKTAFSYNGEAQTIFPKDRSKDSEIGHVAFKPLAFSDVKAVNMMYKCNEHCVRVPSCQAPCFVNKDCNCFCKGDMPKPPCENKAGDSQCQEWATRGECDANSDYMHGYCTKACNVCSDSESGGGGGGGVGGGENSGPANSDDCKNLHGDQECTGWAARGECEKNRDWMTSNCRKACDKCMSKAPTASTASTASTESVATTTPNPTQSGVTCEDQASGCAAWSMYCFSNEYVIKNCLKTCKRCDQAPAPSGPEGRKPKQKERGRGRKLGHRGRIGKGRPWRK